MRGDALGFFWDDLPAIKKAKVEVEKREPPAATWLKPGYLPGLEEAKRFPIHEMTDHELVAAAHAQERLMFDIEIYTNYFLVIFRSIVSGHVIVFEQRYNNRQTIDDGKLKWVLDHFTIFSFNGLNFDIPLLALYLDGVEVDMIKNEADNIILFRHRPQDILKKHKVAKLKCDHIDLIEIAPLRAGLKVYGGRLHTPRMQDLPFHPSTVLNDDQMDIVKWYCVNDTTSTAFLHECLRPQIDLRYEISNEQQEDLRSKSDAQIAEAVIRNEYKRLTGRRIGKSPIEPGHRFKYRTPSFLSFSHPELQKALWTIENLEFVVGEDGYVKLPPEITDLLVKIGDSSYQMSIGGLHSKEKSRAVYSSATHVLVDADVASYYPAIILTLGLFPEHIGAIFLQIYRGIRDRRLLAKKNKNKEVAESLKIVINGTYGKLSSMYSALYAPHHGIQITLTGQLCLLMLIEWLESAGIRVVSGNTDGVMFLCPWDIVQFNEKNEVVGGKLHEIIQTWMTRTDFELETVNYKSVFSKDVNNYIAIKDDGDLKGKGLYANPWSSRSKEPAEKKLHKNPSTTICLEAVRDFLVYGADIAQTIWDCKDITKFTSVRTVKGGAVKVWDEEGYNEYLGTSIRWYYATGIDGEIIYASNGNKVPKSDGARPLMTLPLDFPQDIDYDWYFKECLGILEDIGYSPKAPKETAGRAKSSLLPAPPSPEPRRSMQDWQ